jgi:hypothetical protein
MDNASLHARGRRRKWSYDEAEDGEESKQSDGKRFDLH